MGRILEASPAVREAFEVRVHWVGEQYAHAKDWEQEIADADLIFLQEVPELPSYPLRHWNQGRARFVRFPFLTMPGLWPFDTAKGGADPVATAIQASGRGREFHFQDQLLARMRRHIADPDERFEAYRTLCAPRYPKLAAYLARLDLRAYCAQSLARLARQDGAHGLGVGAAVAGLLAHVPLFHTVTHPAAPLLRRLAGELLGREGIALEPHAALEDGFGAYQVPVHPMLAEALGIAWAPPGRTWRFHTRWITFEAYYRGYIEVFG